MSRRSCPRGVIEPGDLGALVGLLALCLASSAAAGPPGASPAPRAGAAEPGIYDLALVDRVLHCAALEGESVSAQDRELLTREVASLRRAFGAAARAAAAAPRDGASRAGRPAVTSESCFESQSTQCVRELRLTRCEDLGRQLEAGGAEGLVPAGEPPTWARLYGAALAGRVRECAAAERGRAAMPAEEHLLGEFATRMAGVLSLLTSRGTCTVDEEALETCLGVVQGLDCQAMARSLQARDEAQLKGMLQPCPGFLRCGRPRAAPPAGGGPDGGRHGGGGAPRRGRRRRR